MSDQPTRPIIIKKVNKKHDGHHGGSWKVAYADFVTAMMAFFLLMWLLAMVSPEKRAALEAYFNNFTVFKDYKSSFQEGQGGGPGFINMGTGRTNNAKVVAANRQLKKKIDEAVTKNLKGLENQVMVDVSEDGVRIQIVDNEGSQMFPSGSDQPTEKAQQILSLVGENIKGLSNKIAIEGHTDSIPYRKEQSTNWELSTARASSARRQLEQAGIDPVRIAKVVGYADQQLLYKDNPKDPRNRRISIIVMNSTDKELPVVPKDSLKAIPDQIPTLGPEMLSRPPAGSAAPAKPFVIPIK